MLLFYAADSDLWQNNNKRKEVHNFPVFAESDPELLLSVFISVLSDELNKWRFKKYSISKYVIQYGKTSKE